jgi:hypothetical protein
LNTCPCFLFLMTTLLLNPGSKMAHLLLTGVDGQIWDSLLLFWCVKTSLGFSSKQTLATQPRHLSAAWPLLWSSIKVPNPTKLKFVFSAALQTALPFAWSKDSWGILIWLQGKAENWPYEVVNSAVHSTVSVWNWKGQLRLMFFSSE